ncbi:MAG TPA: hydroxyethylthiazole kinase [Gemmatimonadaceae bacterium]|nr:hydroxyethylthiazole kinase [Gemmatimonadaceae bacterium]
MHLDIASALNRLRTEAPLVHNITNYVVMNTTANALLAIGASPAMVHAPDEVEEFVEISRALVVNIGTLSAHWVDAMHRAVDRANAKGIPWVLDPVGAGATSYRTRVAAELARKQPAVLRGNASEILAVAGAAGRTTKGVDSVHSPQAVLQEARNLAQTLGTVVAMTGAVDIVTDGQQVARISNGHAMMARVTGLGCTATALTGAYCAVEKPFPAAVAALAALGVAGERAASAAEGPGSLQLRLLDELYKLDSETLASARIEIE